MAETIACACGKTYAWKPQLAGKRGKCKCGAVIAFPIEAPVAEVAVEEDDPFASMDDLAALERGSRVVESSAAPAPLPGPYTAPKTSGASRGSTSGATSAVITGAPTMRQKIGFLAGGVVAMALFAGWPMVQVLQGEPSINVSFKGILLGTMLLMAGLNVVILGDKGIPWKKTAAQSLNTFQKACVAATAVGAVIVAALVWLFFHFNGYSMRF